ncbi:restriction endonuclease [Paenibacillus sp. HWE-109]|uniref:restriction endonuclease n=1 Tax=Paenibacillus sp. HWE-109 TaxID=1306526 RepID=UPI001EDFCE7D|nr:restriction endonuclease [Paenibacillus sp. HWE-109]UKS27373.1 restriction endonuclease [Paenibacillus sp. HWE-109]
MNVFYLAERHRTLNITAYKEEYRGLARCASCHVPIIYISQTKNRKAYFRTSPLNSHSIECVSAWTGIDNLFIDKINKSSSITEIWHAKKEESPLWFKTYPTSILLAMELINKGKLLSEMNWRTFEELVGHLLESEGWKVRLTKATRDGGIDVIACKHHEIIGEIKSIWQAKKYGVNNYVHLNQVRELSAIREDNNATKALIVTTSRLTKDALDYVKRDTYRLGYKENEDMKRWVENVFYKEYRNNN